MPDLSKNPNLFLELAMTPAQYAFMVKAQGWIRDYDYAEFERRMLDEMAEDIKAGRRTREELIAGLLRVYEDGLESLRDD